MRTAGVAFGIVAALALSACAGDKDKDITNVFPADFKNEIAFTLTKTLDDPTNIKDAYYSDPVVDPATQHYYSCVRYNPRDANKQYTGSRDDIGYYFSGKLNQLVRATPEQCGKAAYKPFPELEKLCQGKTCQ